MGIHNELLDILVCPRDRTRLTIADADLVLEVNRAIEAGAVRNLAGDVVSARLDGALVTQDHSRLYPIRHDIPIMLLDESIPLNQLGAQSR